MALNISQQMFGYLLIALGIIVAVGAFVSFRKYGKMKLSYLFLIIVALGMGIKFAFFTPATTSPVIENKEISFPKPNH